MVRTYLIAFALLLFSPLTWAIEEQSPESGDNLGECQLSLFAELPTQVKPELEVPAPLLKRFLSIPKRMRDLVDGRIKRGELNDQQFQLLIKFLEDRHVYPSAGILSASYAWGLARDHYHWSDALSLHQSNFLRGVGLALIFDILLRRLSRDESIANMRVICTWLVMANIMFETPLVGGPRWDVADLTAGLAGVVVSYAIYRWSEYKFTQKHLSKIPEP